MFSLGFNDNSIGKIERRLAIGSFGPASWRWKRVYFSKFRIEVHRELNPHIAILGESGGGKSNACKLILRDLAAGGTKLIVFDVHNEYVRIANDVSAEVYDAAYNGVNLLGLDGLGPKERASELTEMMKRAFRLGEVQGSALFKCLSYTYRIGLELGSEPTIKDLLFTISVFKKHADKPEIKVLDAIEKRLAVLNANSVARPRSFEDFVGRSSIFALSGLHTNEAQSLYIEGFLKRLYTRMLSMEKSDTVHTYVVIDEAEKLCESTVVSRIISEGRKYGIGIITIAQRAKGLDRSIRSNASLVISFYQREPEELNYISNLIAGGTELNRFAEVRKGVRRLRRGCAVVAGTSAEPKVVRFRAYKVLDEYLGDYITGICRNAVSRKALLRRMAEKGFDESAVDKELSKLLENGSIKCFAIPGIERKEGRMTGPAQGRWYISMPMNSAEHDIYVNLISRHLNRLGIRNIMYNSTYGPDIVAFCKGRKIAVEYETGSKDVRDTIGMVEARRSRYARVVVIVNDSYLKKFASAGLDCKPVSLFFGSRDPLGEI